MSAEFERDGTAWISASTGTRWVPVIGLEVHAQLATQSKLFCACEVRFGAPPNTLTCPICTGQPGTLPVLNATAVELAVRVALAVGAEVAAESKFDRKNYFYCDIPKNFQISQFDRPYCTGGGIQLPSGRFVRLTRIHIEEDAGKAIHDRGDETLVDLNRAGVALIESVSEADMESPEEAVEYLEALKEIIRYVGAGEADMEKGQLRCDVNVSVRPQGEPWRTKVEIKNLNSFRNAREALEYEIPRQIEAYESGDETRFPRQETRLFDVRAGVTRTMRSKEGASDYRYFAEPDLPPLALSESFVERQRGLLCELPEARRRRYREELGLSEYDARVLTAVREVADWFEAAARLSGRPKETANWIANDVLGGLADPKIEATSIDELPLKPFDLAELIALVAEGTLHSTGAREVMGEMLRTGAAPRALVAERGLEQVEDEGRLEVWCREALEGREQVVADVRAGRIKALGAAVGPVMKASAGKANPRRVREILLRIIGEDE
ncbi:MAG: Asp-tRNA(Asn)/Glu-tRNA(Gln) amidotransferase subunit GatB [Planctomycetota bacterium]|nr:Asp-tRNA(Asn)/Glu-tRNA(Gln) amidotransferase subunit GatB [Planctomycetota bacterium]